MNLSEYPFTAPPKPELTLRLLVALDGDFVWEGEMLHRLLNDSGDYGSLVEDTIKELAEFLVEEMEIEDETEIGFFLSWGELVSTEDGLEASLPVVKIGDDHRDKVAHARLDEAVWIAIRKAREADEPKAVD